MFTGIRRGSSTQQTGTPCCAEDATMGRNRSTEREEKQAICHIQGKRKGILKSNPREDDKREIGMIQECVQRQALKLADLKKMPVLLPDNQQSTKRSSSVHGTRCTNNATAIRPGTLLANPTTTNVCCKASSSKNPSYLVVPSSRTGMSVVSKLRLVLQSGLLLQFFHQHGLHLSSLPGAPFVSSSLVLAF